MKGELVYGGPSMIKAIPKLTVSRWMRRRATYVMLRPWRDRLDGGASVGVRGGDKAPSSSLKLRNNGQAAAPDLRK